jgi:hypothetical protein
MTLWRFLDRKAPLAHAHLRPMHKRIATGPPEIGITTGIPSNNHVHFSVKPRAKRVSPVLKTRPKREMICSLHDDGGERRSTEKWKTSIA